MITPDEKIRLANILSEGWQGWPQRGTIMTTSTWHNTTDGDLIVNAPSGSVIVHAGEDVELDSDPGITGLEMKHAAPARTSPSNRPPARHDGPTDPVGHHDAPASWRSTPTK
jgi:hypothetical protein